MTRKAVFFDRDGVINVSPPSKGYVERWADFTFHESIFDWVRLVNSLGYLVIVVTNQRGVALGRMTIEDVEDIHAKMRAEFTRRGCRIDDVYYCPHADGVCECRKPLPGMVHAARDKWDIDLTGSVVIGDSERDRGLAAACGMPFVLAADGRLVEN